MSKSPATRVALSLGAALAGAALAWVIGMFLWGGYYPFWPEDPESRSALNGGMTRMYMIAFAGGGALWSWWETDR